MKKTFIIIICFLLAGGILSALEDFKQIDELIAEKDYREAERLLGSSGLSRVGTGIRNAIILIEDKTSGYDWSNLTKGQKDAIVDVYEQSLEIIEDTFLLPGADSDPEMHRLYFYRAFIKALIAGVKRNMGFLSEIKHIFSDIEKSLDLEPEFIDSVFFAAGLYQFLPGWPISRGSNEKAISWYRYGLGILENGKAEMTADDLQGVIARNRLNLAACLADRNWKADKRKKEQEDCRKKHSKAGNIIEEIDCYEGIAVLENISDMEEAGKLYKQAEDYFYGLKDPTEEESEEIKALLISVSQKLE